MAKSKGIYVAVAPLALLLFAGLGAHFLPILLHDNQDGPENAPPPPRAHGPKHAPLVPPVRQTPKAVDAKTQAVLQKAVSGQIAAFHRNDFGGALAFSAPRFRAMITPDSFRMTISQAYPALMNAVTQTFERAHRTDTDAAIPVLLAGNDGTVTRYMYVLHLDNGNWFITGCSPMGPMMPMEQKSATQPAAAPLSARI